MANKATILLFMCIGLYNLWFVQASEPKCTWTSEHELLFAYGGQTVVAIYSSFTTPERSKIICIYRIYFYFVHLYGASVVSELCWLDYVTE